jgi:hypothetical protein
MSVAVADGAALAEEPPWSGMMQPLHHDGAAVFAHSQDIRDTPAADMTGWLGRCFRATPQMPEEFSPG